MTHQWLSVTTPTNLRHKQTHTHIATHACTHGHTDTHRHARMHTHTHTGTYAHTHTYTSTHSPEVLKTWYSRVRRLKVVTLKTGHNQSENISIKYYIVTINMNGILMQQVWMYLKTSSNDKIPTELFDIMRKFRDSTGQGVLFIICTVYHRVILNCELPCISKQHTWRIYK